MLETLAKWISQRPGETSESAYARVWGNNAVTPSEISSVLLGYYPIDHLLVNHEQAESSASLVASAIIRITGVYLSKKRSIVQQASLAYEQPDVVPQEVHT